MADEKKEDNTDPNLKEISVKYLKSNFFRVVHANGIFGGISGRGELHFGFYSERRGLPDKGIMYFSETKGIVGQEKFEGANETVREFEVDIVVDYPTALQIRTWLNRHISTMEKLFQEAQEEVQENANVDTSKSNE